LIKVVLSKFFLSQLPGIASAYSRHVCPALLSWEKIDACVCGHPEGRQSALTAFPWTAPEVRAR
jgi:hypothetical protein